MSASQLSLLRKLIGSASAKPNSVAAVSTSPHNIIQTPSSSSDVTFESTKRLYWAIKSILAGDAELDGGVAPATKNNGDRLEHEMVMSRNISLRRKEISHERKQKWIFKSNQTNRFDRIVKMCGQKLGADTTINLLGKLGCGTGLKEERVRKAEDKDTLLRQSHNAYQLYAMMKEHGSPLTQEIYGPFLTYLIDMGMVKDFFYFGDKIKEDNPDSLPSFAYYEMLLWISVGAEDKIQELCNSLRDYDDSDKFIFLENYLVALCDGNRKEEVLLLLGTIDISKVSSVKSVASIFKSLGRLSLESFAKKFIVQLQTNGIGAEDVSNFIYNYASGMSKIQNHRVQPKEKALEIRFIDKVAFYMQDCFGNNCFKVEDIALRFKNLHEEFALNPSRVPYEKLIRFSCDSHKVHVALDIVDWMLEAELTVSIETFHSILNSSLESCEYNLVHRIYSSIRSHKLKPNSETFRIMITLCVKMKDFDSAYAMIKRMGKMNIMPTANIYNVIMAEYFRKKDLHGGMMVLKQMEDADVKPDSQTFSCIINNCSSVEDINKYHEELKSSGVTATNNIFLALINAYAACGQFEKAKEVVLDKGIPVKSLNELKSGLVSALASNGLMSDALNVYKEIKQLKAAYLEPKAIISLIEHLQTEGEQLDRLLQLLEQLKDTDYWVDGCFRVILYCIRHKHLGLAEDLLKQLKNKHGRSNEMAKHWAIMNALFPSWAS